MPVLDIPESFNAASAFIDRHILEGRGERVALRCHEQTVTYAQLAANVNRVGNALQRLGVRPEERVVMAVVDSPEFVYSFWGAIKIGAVPVPVNTFLRADEYAYVLENSRASVLIASQEVWPVVASLSPRGLRLRVVVGNVGGDTPSLVQLMEKESPTLEAEPTHRDDMALWLYSSGSTGLPKGVIHLHRDLLYCSATYAQDVLGMGPDDVTLSAARLFFAYGLGGGMYFALHTGGVAALVSERPTPESMFAAIHRYRPTIFFGVPTLYAAMLQIREVEQHYDLSSLRLCASAGEALPAELYYRWKERFGVEILDGIGSTEALHIFLSNRAGQVRPGSSGTPVPGYEVRIVDEKGHDVSQGEVGDLLVRGGSITAGYWRRLEATRRALQGEWLRTGDTYYQDADGVYWYCGRSDDMLKVSGQWVSPAEIEGILFQHPAVLEAAVVGWEDEHRLIKPKAFVVLKEGQHPSPALAEELQTFVRERTLPHKYPRWIEFTPELPKTATGKIQRYKLRARSEKQ
ncbi:MAG TPA: benzoate-CoA ligase family protein [Methylomirabilota bacterium]|nr:benzoate-CoA ligase family protein [Methylomirabilota bacterium]